MSSESSCTTQDPGSKKKKIEGEGGNVADSDET